MSAFDFQAWMQHELAEVEVALGGWVGTGTPETLAANPASHTGRYLRRYLALPS